MRNEMAETLRAQKEALEEALNTKLNELRELCLQEAVS